MCLAIPGQIVEIFADQPNSALIEVVGVRRKVDLGLLEDDPPKAGDWVLIHVGFAMSKISEHDAPPPSIEQRLSRRRPGKTTPGAPPRGAPRWVAPW